MARKFTNGKYGSALPVRVTPRSSRNEIVGIMSDNTVKIKLTAPPVDGKANKELVNFLADVLRVPKSSVNIVAGETGRDKLVSILDLDTEEVHQKLMAYIK